MSSFPATWRHSFFISRPAIIALYKTLSRHYIIVGGPRSCGDISAVTSSLPILSTNTAPSLSPPPLYWRQLEAGASHVGKHLLQLHSEQLGSGEIVEVNVT